MPLQVKRLEELERTENMYPGVVEHTGDTLITLYDTLMTSSPSCHLITPSLYPHAITGEASRRAGTGGKHVYPGVVEHPDNTLTTPSLHPYDTLMPPDNTLIIPSCHHR